MCEHEEEQAEREKEVVLDSEEDEETRVESARPFFRTKRNVVGPSYLESSAGGTGCLDKSMPDKQESAEVKNVGSQEPRECSQAHALEVIERLAASDGMEKFRGVDPAKVVKEKAPCVLTVKGVHTLARRIGFTSPAGDIGPFEWVDGSVSKELKDENSGSWTKRSKIEYMDSMGEADSIRNDSRYVESIDREDQNEVLGEGRKIDFIRDVDRNLDVEASGHQLHDDLLYVSTEDDYDVGFATQMAAEAMEALSHAPSSSTCSTFSPGLQTTSANPRAIVADGSLDGFSSMRKRSTRFTQSRRLKEMNDLQKNRDYGYNSEKLLGKNSCKRSSTSGRRAMGKKTAGISKTEKREDVAHGFPMSSEYTILPRTHIELEQNLNGNALVKGWFRSKAKPGRMKSQMGNLGENVNVVGNTDRSEQIVGETVLLDNSCELKRHTLSSFVLKPSKISESRLLDVTGPIVSIPTSASDSWNYPKRKRTPSNVRSFVTGARDSKVHASQTVSKNKLNGSQREGCLCPNDIGTMASCSPDNEGIFAKKKAKVSCSLDAALVDNFLAPDKTVAPETADSSKCLKMSGVEEAKDLPSCLESLDVSCMKHATATAIDSSKNGNPDKPQDKKHPSSFWLRELNRLGVSNVMPNCEWKDLRKQRHMAYVRVLLSQHLEEVLSRQQKKICLRLAIPMATSIVDATHFIADKFVRTRNMLEAIAFGKQVVTPLWLQSCLQAGYLIAENCFILRDAKMEKKLAFDLPSSLLRARRRPLLKGKVVLITPNIGPDKEMILRLIVALHGQAMETSYTSVIEDQKNIDELLVLSCAEDHAVYSRFLKMGVGVYSSELLLHGIVTQKLDYERFQLCGSEMEMDQARMSSRRSKSSN